MYDVAIIGAGIIGTAIARELSRYRLKVVLLEGESDLANGTTKANSAIIHAGYDPEPGTLKAELNVEGNELCRILCAELGVPYRQLGSLVVAFSEGECQTLAELYENGRVNGVPGLELLNEGPLRELEPSLSKSARGALYAATAAITDPYLLAIALAENAVENGVELRLDQPVEKIRRTGRGYLLSCPGALLESRTVINAAGLYADQVNEMVAPPSFEIRPNRGEYYLLDKSAGSFVRHVVFPCPTALGKGVLVAPTVHGNLLVGPNSEEVGERDAVQTTAAGLALVKAQAKRMFNGLPLREVITSFSGLRAKTPSADFIIAEAAGNPGFINVAAIDSPGLTAAPAIALYAIRLLQAAAGPFVKKESHIPPRKKHTPFIELPAAEQQRLLEADPRYGRVICRCENITEGEIVDAIRRPAGARTVDGIKKRVRAGGGRCQGGFCGPKVMQIIARELGLDLAGVTKDGPGSPILTGPIGGGSSVRRRDWGPTDKGDSVPVRAADGRTDYDVIVVGGGPAGMAAALAAREGGAAEVLVIEREPELGGILQQCIHNGFGLHIFKEELTGPEYAERFIREIAAEKITCKKGTMVLQVTADRQITYVNPREGLTTIKAGAVVLAMGCRERTRGAINVPGTRPAGILSAGSAQHFVNIEGYLVGEKVVVFGSGDIGLIMARRMLLEGAEVVAVIERKAYSEGLTRNLIQCVHDFEIPLLLCHTIVGIKGRKRVSGITIARTDENKEPLPGTERDLACDTVLFSRGLIPENELSRGAGIPLSPFTGGPLVNESMETAVPGIFACGNVLHVHDLVDWVTVESRKAGLAAARFLQQPGGDALIFETVPGEGISYIVPQKVRVNRLEDTLELYMRVRGRHQKSTLLIKADGAVVKRVKKKALAPGEMVVVKIAQKELPAENFNRLSVELGKESR